MKRLVHKTKGLVKGLPSAVLISALIHFILLSVVGGLVVFSVVKKQAKTFVSPVKIERPQLQLKKMRVKMKNPVKPPSAQRIAAKNSPTMPDIQLPDVSGAGSSGLGGGLGGYELIPDVSDIGMFGGAKSVAVGNDFEGTFYVLNWGRQGKDLNYDVEKAQDTVTRFIENDWSPYVFAPYYRSPKKLYATQFLVPWTPSPYGPRAFGVEDTSEKSFPEWVVHYKGKIASKKGGRYRFWGCAGEILFVRINGELVLNGSYFGWQRDLYDWGPTAKEHLQYQLGEGFAAVGFWFTLQPGEIVEMEVLTGDLSPPHFGVFLLIEDDAESAFYSKRKDGMPILPVFRTAEMTSAIKDEIKYYDYPGDADYDGGEIFNVH